MAALCCSADLGSIPNQCVVNIVALFFGASPTPQGFPILPLLSILTVYYEIIYYLLLLLSSITITISRCYDIYNMLLMYSDVVGCVACVGPETGGHD